MATLFMDNFEVYGRWQRMLDGAWADGLLRDDATQRIDNRPWLQFRTNADNFFIRRVLPGTYSTLLVGMRIREVTLPGGDRGSWFVSFNDISNNSQVTIAVDSTGRLIAIRGNVNSGTEIVRSGSPVMVADTAQFVEMKVNFAANGSIEIRVDDSSSPALVVTGVNTLPGGLPAQVVFGNRGDAPTAFLTDVHVWDTSGTRNTDFLGDIQVTTLWPNEDVETGWAPNPRRRIGSGILQCKGQGAVTCLDSPNFEMGSGDFTLETFVRFDNLPTGTNQAVIFSKWDDATNNRSYRLYKNGPATVNGNLEFQCSTGGTAGTVTTVHSIPWNPETDRWYHVAVVRASGDNMLFIDGVMQGIPRPNAVTYFDGGAAFSIDSNTPSLTLDGWFDETRISRVARYTSNFAPTNVPFGRNTGSDPQFSSVVLLAGYDNGIADESSFARTMTAQGGAVALQTDDGFFQFQTINAEDTLALQPPRDDTNISAAFLRASSVLTLIDNPSPAETVTIGPVTYTFRTTVSVANDVRIGPDMAGTLSNLAAAINTSGGAGTVYGTGTVQHPTVFAEEMPSPQVRVSARLSGSGGNSIAVSETLDGAWAGSTLTGGQNIPGPSSFRVTRLPPGVTNIRSVMAVTRAYKTDSGPAKMRTNLVGPAGATTLGPEVSLPVDPRYSFGVFEADPDGGVVTPTTLIQGRIQFNRTE